ncbi:hypothetical protein HRI_002310000 [Hibiscus trionum]|uniref:Uncharacterized protein n=1 Tax=Hibiscus trionum TaxID=183268 RepID=A0A9W7HZU8_HIBTR|nr:hypothetical protein HRI_002310000 [Hibiscus trionum]
MHAEFSSQVSFLSMSNSELILVKDEANLIEFDILKRQPLEFQEECCEARAIHNSSNDVPNDERQLQVAEDDEEKKREESNVKAVGEFKALVVDDEDDGFKTPTSLDYKISEMKQCSSAPRKPKANKRATSPSPSSSGTAYTSTRRNLHP